MTPRRILRKQRGRTWIGFIWLWAGSCGGILRTLRFHRSLGTHWSSKRLLVFQEGLLHGVSFETIHFCTYQTFQLSVKNPTEVRVCQVKDFYFALCHKKQVPSDLISFLVFVRLSRIARCTLFYQHAHEEWLVLSGVLVHNLVDWEHRSTLM